MSKTEVTRYRKNREQVKNRKGSRKMKAVTQEWGLGGARSS